MIDRARLEAVVQQADLAPSVHNTQPARWQQSEERFTWRAPFDAGDPGLFGWSRADAVLVLDATNRNWIAAQNDWASLGLAGWPMTALSDHSDTAAALCDAFAIGPERWLVQVIRFGVPTGAAPMRVRRPLQEILR